MDSKPVFALYVEMPQQFSLTLRLRTVIRSVSWDPEIDPCAIHRESAKGFSHFGFSPK